MNDTATNGTELPATRKAAVEYGLTQFNHVAAERDEYERKMREHETTIAGYKVAMEAQASRVAELESRLQTAMATRDQAVADRAVYETLFISFQSQLRAFAVPHAPLVKEASGGT